MLSTRALIASAVLSLFTAAGSTAISASTIFDKSLNEPTTQNQHIHFGMSTALTGPAAQLGINMQAGVNAAFNEANANAEIQGFELDLITLDDGYEPSRTAPNMRTLIEDHDTLAIIGNVGTPTAIAAIPIANAQETLLFGAYTGAGALRKSPPDRFVINYRASYAQETAAMVDALIEHAGLSVNEIAFFTQRDAYGDAGFNGGITALKQHGLIDDSTIAHGRYERNTIAVENGLADIIMADTPAKAVIMVGSYAPCAAFIKLAEEYELDAIFLNVSFVGSTPLANELGSTGNGVIITQVVPHFNSSLQIANEFRTAFSAFNPDAIPNFGSFEGYIAARIMIKAIAQSTTMPTRATIVDAIEALGTFDIGLGSNLSLTADNHQASTNVWPTMIMDSQVVAFSWEDLSNPKEGALSEAKSDQD